MDAYGLRLVGNLRYFRVQSGVSGDTTFIFSVKNNILLAALVREMLFVLSPSLQRIIPCIDPVVLIKALSASKGKRFNTQEKLKTD